MENMIYGIICNLNRICNYILETKFSNKILYYKCMIEFYSVLKNTFTKITNIYNKYILIPKLNNL